MVRARIYDKDSGFRDVLSSVTVEEVAPTLTAAGDSTFQEPLTQAGFNLQFLPAAAFATL